MNSKTLILMMLVLSSSCKTSTNSLEAIDAPAVYYGMVSQDSLLYEYKRGNLSLSSSKPINDHSQFALFSITKVFTAMAMMQLAQKGDLRLNDQAIQYLPDYPFLGEITIRHLLAHQSGINNPLPISWVHLTEEDADFDFEGFSRNILTEKAKVKYKPGRKASYSNLNYIILGEIISRVSGLSYQDYIEKFVLLSNEEMGFKWKESQAVTGYHPSGIQAWILSVLLDKDKYTEAKEGKMISFKKLNLNGSAHGGLLASPSGVRVFLQEFLKSNNKILPDELKSAMFKEQSLSNGSSSGHSLGWFTGNLNGDNYVHHPGGGGGFYLELRIYPDKGIATYLLTNKSGFSDQRLLDKIDGKLINLL